MRNFFKNNFKEGHIADVPLAYTDSHVNKHRQIQIADLDPKLDLDPEMDLDLAPDPDMF
jgi:hypothetical protein